jgi:hypothetical protein
MINNRLIIIAVATVFLVGCSEKYDHDRLGTDGPEATQVRALVSVLRQSGPDGLDKTIALQALPDLTGDQLKALSSALDMIVAADSVELHKIDKFGKQVYRVVFALDTDGAPASLAMLLSFGDGDELRWIGKN